ncbi:pickpocket protein 28-like [Chironomus tepperi]|uniref:pickpocket protein 28-like n=1 Tax=Chironomus tepperi TaxID=113505 RepID=UPI00391F19DF
MSFAAAFSRKKLILFKIFKVFGYFLLLIGLGYQTQRLYKKLKIEPEIFTKESSIQSSQIPFPAVTFCPPFSIKQEAWNPEYMKEMNLNINDLRGASIQTCPNHDLYMAYQDSEFNVVEVLLKSAPNFKDVVYHCGINKYLVYNQDCDKLFIRSVTEYGICFTFNMLGHKSLFTHNVSSDFDTFKRTNISTTWNAEFVMNESRHEDDEEPSAWSLETGYTSNDNYIQPARALKMQTLSIGVANALNETLCEEREKNYKLLMNLPNELPQTSYETIDIPMNIENIILISAKVTQYEESLKVFRPDKRGCYFEDEKPLNVFKSYTKANCEYECMTNFVNKSCGCVKFSMPRTKDMKVCDFIQYSCVMSITEIFPRSYYEDQENMMNYPEYPCGCLPSCTDIKYKVIKKEKKSEYIHDTLMYASIKVIFADSQIEKTSNYVTYEMENFIFDVGGLIGLFLGSSILSVLELLLGIFRIIRNYSEMIRNAVKSRRTNRVQEQVVSPNRSMCTIFNQELETREPHIVDLED